MADSLVKNFRKHFEAIKVDRADWEPGWRDIAKGFSPVRSRFSITETNKNNQSRLNTPLNNCGSRVRRVFRAGLTNGTCSPARPWFRLGLADMDQANKSRPVREYLEALERIFLEIYRSSNFYRAIPMTLDDCGTFGTSCVIPTEDFDNVMHFTPVVTGQFWLNTGDNGKVNAMFRQFTLNSKAAMQKFSGKVSNRALMAYNNSDYTTKFEFVHCICENPDAKNNAIYGRDKSYKSVYFEPSDTEDTLNRESGYDIFPVMAPRWEPTGEDTYGYGCGAVALGDNNQLQLQERRKAQAIDKMVSPPLQAPTKMKDQPIAGIAGGITFADPDVQGRQAINPLYTVDPRLAELREDMAAVEARIEDAFYYNLFLMLANDTRSNITATEIAQRQEEKLVMLGPAMESVHNELFDPIISATLYYADKAGILPPAPKELQGKAIKVEYISTIAQAQKMVGIATVERFVGFIGNLSQFFPAVRHKVDPFATVDQVGDMLGIRSGIIRGTDEAQRDAASEAQQAQAAQMMQMGLAGTQAAKQLSEAKTARGSVLDTLSGV